MHGGKPAQSRTLTCLLSCADPPALREALANLAWQVQFEHDVVISDVIRSVDQLRRMQARRFPYHQSIEREGILLWNASLTAWSAFYARQARYRVTGWSPPHNLPEKSK